MRSKENTVVPPASVGAVSSVILGWNETIRTGDTAVVKTRYIQVLFTVVQHEEILSSLW